MALDSEEEKCEKWISDRCFSKSFLLQRSCDRTGIGHSITTMDIHSMFDNFALKCTLNGFFCVQYVFDDLG